VRKKKIKKNSILLRFFNFFLHPIIALHFLWCSPFTLLN